MAAAFTNADGAQLQVFMYLLHPHCILGRHRDFECKRTTKESTHFIKTRIKTIRIPTKTKQVRNALFMYSVSQTN